MTDKNLHVIVASSQSLCIYVSPLHIGQFSFCTIDLTFYNGNNTMGVRRGQEDLLSRTLDLMDTKNILTLCGYFP